MVNDNVNFFGENKEESNASMFGAMAAGAASGQAGATQEYTVEKGDTLSEIGSRYGVSWKEIYEANRDVIADPDMIQVGWKLKIPQKHA